MKRESLVKSGFFRMIYDNKLADTNLSAYLSIPTYTHDHWTLGGNKS